MDSCRAFCAGAMAFALEGCVPPIARARSDPDEDLVPVHPEQHEPEGKHDRDSQQERLQARTEYLKGPVSQMSMETADDECFAEMRDEIGGHGVESHDDQRESPAAMSLGIDDPGEGGQEEEADATAKQRPGRSPDALDDGADTREM